MDVKKKLICEHYQNFCELRCEECRKFFGCRFCHDLIVAEEHEKMLKKPLIGCCTTTTKHNCDYHKERHTFDRFNVKQLRCKLCFTEQEVSNRCKSCQIVFGKFSCTTCHIFDNDTSKRQFHCKGCGVCRTGGRENFFHCDPCGACLSVEVADDHRHIADVIKGDCPICLEDMYRSREQSVFLNCGHAMH
jgi:RING finger/CHY zinc finger protein 1